MITAPEASEKASRETYPQIEPLIKGDDKLSVVDRLNIYAIAYFFRILDILKDDFQGILGMIGEEAFHQLISDYLQQYPSSSFTIRDVGNRLSDFLTTYEPLKSKLYLSDLAKLEWEIIEAFDAPDSPVLTLKELSSFKPDDWSRLQFELIPSLHLLSVSWRVDDALSKTRKGKPPSSAKKQAAWIRIWRKDYKVYYRALDSIEIKLINLLQKGQPFECLCEEAGKQMGFDRGVPFVAGRLQSWLADGMLASVEMIYSRGFTPG